MAGRDVINEDFVNLPNPQLFKIYVEQKEIDYQKIIRRFSRLDLKQGQEFDEYDFQTEKGILHLQTVKIVDPVNYHLFGLELSLTPEFDAPIQVDSIVDTAILNQNVERYRDFDSREFDVKSIENKSVMAQTRQSEIKIHLFVNTTSEENLDAILIQNDQELIERFKFDGKSDVTNHFSKVIGLTTSNELNYEPQKVAEQVQDTNLDQIFARADLYWSQFWKFHDLIVESDNSELQTLIRLNIFHLQQAANHNANQYLDASVSSRALTGEGYRGHIFWDEIFFIPYYAKNDPATARDLIHYRIRRLAAAKQNARLDDEAGAMYSWQSGMYGDEQAQVIHLNPVDNKWDPDNSRLQRHISLAIAYDVWYYYHVTGDATILNEGALEMILEICKFWLHKAILDDQGRYDINGVMGPDEFHEKYPGAKNGGFTNNAYTNIMLAWILDWVNKLAEDPKVSFGRISKEIGFSSDLMKKGQEVSRKLNLEIKDGIIAQFAGYFNLKRLDFAEYEKKYGDIHRIDRILKAEGKSPDDYQVAKQADVLMTIYNLGSSETKRIINQLGYDLPDDWLEKNTKYYLERTTHGSTTSRPVFAISLADLGQKEKAEEFLETAIGSDYYDIQGGTTAEGIHIGVMGETLEVITSCFAGINIMGEILKVQPQLPPKWDKVQLETNFKEVSYNFEISSDQVQVIADDDCQINVFGQDRLLKGHEKSVFKR
ncbi:trehalose 6-phosphate phosphorylase [Xylocopilactobacillus apis]|uniref:Trehalose 6-phosphate phosphorylase n=2 Tax=Xylocopilactobacillus apis TaxID=2932183 RepID=A0AAU9CNH3_9LACO|nr:glycosyl hydrolase family 65 protein [Xylocopilactobacillus apis]BDR55484.1 trehalose 6-phosphate phosphorylase [Xylocopilactobacillus apis]